MAIITDQAEIAKLRVSGQIAAAALAAAQAMVKPGITTQALNDAAEKIIRQRGGRPSFLGFQNYPASLCVSINDEVVHGIPSTQRVLAAGDIVGLDIGVDYQGLFTDMAVTVPVGNIDQRTALLIERTQMALMHGLGRIKPGAKVGDISAQIEASIKLFGYGIVRQLTGHGVGRAVHEPPPIPNFGPTGAGPVLEAGMVLAIEPMVTLGGYEVETVADGWTVKTKDHSLAAHFEHTVIVAADGCEIITQS